MASKEWLELGRVGAPYGIKGWVHVQSFTSPPEKLLRYRAWRLTRPHTGEVIEPAVADGGPGLHKMQEGRPQGSAFVVRLAGIEDRDRAARLQGAVISVARSALPKLRRREFYQADLIGLAVGNLDGVELGRVDYFVQTPGGDVMVVRNGAGQEHWVPANKAHLAKVDLDAGRITVDWPATLED